MAGSRKRESMKRILIETVRRNIGRYLALSGLILAASACDGLIDASSEMPGEEREASGFEDSLWQCWVKDPSRTSSQPWYYRILGRLGSGACNAMIIVGEEPQGTPCKSASFGEVTAKPYRGQPGDPPYEVIQGGTITHNILGWDRQCQLEKHLCFSQSTQCEDPQPDPPNTDPFYDLIFSDAGPRSEPVPPTQVPCLVQADSLFSHLGVQVQIDRSCSKGVFHFKDEVCFPRLRWGAAFLEMSTKNVLDTIFAEPNCMGDRIKNAIRTALTQNQGPYTISCSEEKDDPRECGHTLLYRYKDYMGMTLVPQEGSCQRLSMELIIRHEMQHAFAKDDHVKEERSEGPRDRVLACDRACYHDVGMMTFSQPEDCI
jgi:hypothetical protein